MDHSLVYIFTAAYGASFGPVGWVLPSEIFPLSVRSKGVAVSTASNWFNNCARPLFLQCISSNTIRSFGRLGHTRSGRIFCSVSFRVYSAEMMAHDVPDLLSRCLRARVLLRSFGPLGLCRRPEACPLRRWTLSSRRLPARKTV